MAFLNVQGAPANPLTIFSRFANPGGVKVQSVEGQFWQTHLNDGLTEYSTIGPDRNEAFTTYSHGQGTHHMRFLAFVSPDILLVHQSKVAGFYRVVNSPEKVDPIGRDVKDLILKDTNMRITSASVGKAVPSGVALVSSGTSY